MKKSEFFTMLKGATRKPIVITVEDATLVYGKPYTAIVVCWQNTMNRTTLKNIIGSCHNNENHKEVIKFKNWLKEYLNN